MWVWRMLSVSLCVLFSSQYTRDSIQQHPVNTNSVRKGRERSQKRKAYMAIKQSISPCSGAANAILGTILTRSSSLWEFKHDALPGMCISELPWPLFYIKPVPGMISTPLMELSVGTRHLWVKSKGQRMRKGWGLQMNFSVVCQGKKAKECPRNFKVKGNVISFIL